MDIQANQGEESDLSGMNENQILSQKQSYQNCRQFGKEITNQIKLTNDTLSSQFSYYQKLKSQNNKLKKLDVPSAVANFSFNYKNKSTSIPIEPAIIKKVSSNSRLHHSLSQGLHTTFAIEEELENKPQLVPPYANEIINYLTQQEVFFQQLISLLINSHNICADITSSMRSILVDWLVDVHCKFKLVPETLFLTVHLIDRQNQKIFIVDKILKQKQLGVAAMFIACKYEEIYPPNVKEFVYVCDRTYTKEEILEMEKFTLTHTSSLRFLELQIAFDQISERVQWAAKMIIELALIEIKCLQHSPSIQSTAAILLGANLLNQQKLVPQQDSCCEELKLCISDMQELLKNESPLSAVRRKYSHCMFGRISETIFSTN